MDISEEFVKSIVLPDKSNSFTLTTRLGHMLRGAEALYGDRNRDFTILGAEFWTGKPQIWFPGNCQQIAVRIGIECLKDPIRAYFQLSHEVIHLLDPVAVQTQACNNLEEGVATYFAIHYMKMNFKVDCSTWSDRPYDDARLAFEDVLKLCADFGRKIRDKAVVGKPLSQATELDILKACPNCPIDKAKFLAAPFGTRP